MFLSFLQKLAATEWSIALHESLWVWPLIESAHVLTLTIFAGSAMLFDLRLTGHALRSMPAETVLARLLPWTRLGFALMVATGLLFKLWRQRSKPALKARDARVLDGEFRVVNPASLPR